MAGVAATLQSCTWRTIIVFHRSHRLSASSQLVREDTASQSSNSVPPSPEDERREFDAVAAALPKSARQQQLIHYIGEKYFHGEANKLHEYEIATEVFGRSKSTFNAGEDAIVRVEAHRLRKRLKAYYETEGKDHPVQLSIPPGTYVPVFTRVIAGPEKLESETAPAQPERALAGCFMQPRRWRWSWPRFGAYWIVQAHKAEKAGIGAEVSLALPASAINGASFAETPLRILAGYGGKPQIDSAGALWQPDKYYHEGGNWNNPEGFIGRTSDPMLFENWRNGDFFYEIPLRAGVYELHLYFATPAVASNDPSTFSVSVNGSSILSGFDIYSDALGANVADERIFRDISPDSNGILNLGFHSERATASVNAIEILPGTPHMQHPIRLVMQPRSFTDRNGQFWYPDDYFLDGYTSTRHAQITGTDDQGIFAAERYGHFTYAIPVDTRDRYTLILHFAEFYFGPSASGVGGVGSRVFRVVCNGNTLLDNFDIYKEAGSLHARIKTFNHLKPTAQGKLNITFEPIVNNATVSGIEVIDEGP